MLRLQGLRVQQVRIAVSEAPHKPMEALAEFSENALAPGHDDALGSRPCLRRAVLGEVDQLDRQGLSEAGPDSDLPEPSPLRLKDELAARRWLVQQLARRAVEILAEKDNE